MSPPTFATKEAWGSGMWGRSGRHCRSRCGVADDVDEAVHGDRIEGDALCKRLRTCGGKHTQRRDEIGWGKEEGTGAAAAHLSHDWPDQQG